MRQSYRLKDAGKNDVKIMGFPIITCAFSLFNVGRFNRKVILSKRDFKFSFMKNLFCLYKTIERDYIIKRSKNRYSFTNHIID